MGEMPVVGPDTNVELVVVDTIWLADYLPNLSPDSALADPSTQLIYYDDPPFGIQLGYCLNKPCAEDETPIYIDEDTDYWVYGGWYFMQTTPESYNEDGSIKDEVY